MASNGEIQVWYGDESAFHLNPNSAWQNKKSKLSLPAQRGSVLNVLGFITKDLQSAFYEFEGSMNQELFIEKIAHFISHYVTKKTILILDKSSTHTSRAVIEKMKDWKKRNLFIYFLPTASSELNKTEIVWRFIKHHWLSVHDWLSVHKLKDAVRNILKKFGSEYVIQNFKIRIFTEYTKFDVNLYRATA